MKLFREICIYIYIFCKFRRKDLRWSLILIKLQVSILQLYWKKGLQHRCFLVSFATYLNTFFTEHLPTTTSFLRNQNFINEIVKSPLRNRKKWKQLVRKTTTQAKQKLRHYLHQVFISFYYSKRSLFLFSLLPMIHWIIVTRNNKVWKYGP